MDKHSCKGTEIKSSTNIQSYKISPTLWWYVPNKADSLWHVTNSLVPQVICGSWSTKTLQIENISSQIPFTKYKFSNYCIWNTFPFTGFCSAPTYPEKNHIIPLNTVSHNFPRIHFCTWLYHLTLLCCTKGTQNLNPQINLWQIHLCVHSLNGIHNRGKFKAISSADLVLWLHTRATFILTLFRSGNVWDMHAEICA